jgi:hypothetical protein
MSNAAPSAKQKRTVKAVSSQVIQQCLLYSQKSTILGQFFREKADEFFGAQQFV